MDSNDALGPRPERRGAFTPELLSETMDPQLQAIVEQAAVELSAPISLVTMVLDHIQYFKAYHGLPPELAAVRSSSRDVSLCQMAVRDDAPFETSDLTKDQSLPQHIARTYGIRAYLGIPIRLSGTVVGTLCVLDTTPRTFTDEQRTRLGRLAEAVRKRLVTLTQQRDDARATLTQRAQGPAFEELRASLGPLRKSLEAGLPALAAIRSFLNLSEHVRGGGRVAPGTVVNSLKAAFEATTATEHLFYDLEALASECDDCVIALQRLHAAAVVNPLSEVLTAAQDLARPVTRPVGGAPLPSLDLDPDLLAPRPLAVALVTTALSALASALADRGANDGVRTTVLVRDDAVELALSSAGLTSSEMADAAKTLRLHLGDDPAVGVAAFGDALHLVFVTVPRVDEPSARDRDESSQ